MSYESCAGAGRIAARLAKQVERALSEVDLSLLVTEGRREAAERRNAYLAAQRGTTPAAPSIAKK